MHHHGHEDGEQLVPVALHADGDTLEDGVEGECDHEHEAAEGGVLEHGLVHVGVAVVMMMMVVVRLARLVLVVMVVVVAVGGVVGGGVPRQQGRPLLRPGLRGPGLLHRQRRLLYQQDHQEAETHDELRQGVVDIYIVLVLHLFQYLKRELCWNQMSMFQSAHLLDLLLNVGQEVEQAGGYEDAAGEAGAEADDGLPAGAGARVAVVAELAEQLVGQHPEEEGDGGHGEQRDHLLRDQAHPQQPRARHHHLRGEVILVPASPHGNHTCRK